MEIITVTDGNIAQLWIEHATVTGDADACYNVGLLFLFGQGVDADAEEARQWFQKSAEKGHHEGMNNLATLHAQNGNYQEAAKWFEKAAKAGDDMAARNLSLCRKLMDKTE